MIAEVLRLLTDVKTCISSCQSYGRNSRLWMEVHVSRQAEVRVESLLSTLVRDMSAKNISGESSPKVEKMHVVVLVSD
jgi:hypothetical protein